MRSVQAFAHNDRELGPIPEVGALPEDLLTEHGCPSSTINTDMPSETEQINWRDHASERLRRAGYRSGGARKAVIELLASQSCALSALEVEEELRDRGESVGRASIYRALEQLEELELVRRVEVTKGTASYEPADPAGHHHHHIVCERCGKVVPFEDSQLEEAITAVERASDFHISAHEVTLRGHCESC